MRAGYNKNKKQLSKNRREFRKNLKQLRRRDKLMLLMPKRKDVSMKKLKNLELLKNSANIKKNKNAFVRN